DPRRPRGLLRGVPAQDLAAGLPARGLAARHVRRRRGGAAPAAAAAVLAVGAHLPRPRQAHGAPEAQYWPQNGTPGL
ncbi:unnamed protein product, partial [Heterosigma akashiwo]